VCRSYQAHTAYCLPVDDTHRGVGTVKPKFDFGVDGLVSKTKDLLLSVRSADCVPGLLFDPKKQICAAVHAGRRGTVGGICGNAVKEMVSLGSDPKDILAAIGPCIGACCYQVGEEVYTAFFEAGDFAACFTPDKEAGKYLLDLTHANRLVLERAGLAPAHIDEAHTCTRCHGEYFFSHRRMGAERGTMSAFITV
jgi:YfiH family protein